MYRFVCLTTCAPVLSLCLYMFSPICSYREWSQLLVPGFLRQCCLSISPRCYGLSYLILQLWMSLVNIFLPCKRFYLMTFFATVFFILMLCRLVVPLGLSKYVLQSNLSKHFTYLDTDIMSLSSFGSWRLYFLPSTLQLHVSGTFLYKEMFFSNGGSKRVLHIKVLVFHKPGINAWMIQHLSVYTLLW